MADTLQTRFLQLARSYLRDSMAVWEEFMSRAGIGNLEQWKQSGLPLRGTLSGNPDMHYSFHSERPELWLSIGSEKEIDLIFHGFRLGVFDSWRLQLYVHKFTDAYPEFRNEQTLSRAIAEAEKCGLIQATNWTGVYTVSSPAEPAAKD
jgi:hypothetical protein